MSISRTSTADDIKSVEALNDVKIKGRETGKGSGAGSETDLDGGEGSGYVVRIVLNQQRIATEGGMTELRAGMAVTAEIVTGNRRVISYLLSPIQRYAQDAGKER